MQKTLFVLLLVLGLAAMAFASPGDVPRSNLQPGLNNDPTDGNSQYIYIRVTLAGVSFVVANSEWEIGDTTGTWYAYLGNEYHSAGGRRSGALPPSFVHPTDSIWAITFHDDCPIIWNQGGVALDFMLAVSDMSLWYYESKHSSNRLANEAFTSGGSFQNSMQVRAVFSRWGNGATTNLYNDINSYIPTRFKAPTWGVGASAFPTVAAGGDPHLLNTDVVYTTAMAGLAADNAVLTNLWNQNGANQSWYEATSSRFNPLNVGATLDTNNMVIGATSKGLGLAPDRRVTIAMELLTPRKVTRAYYLNGYLQTMKTIKLRVWGTPSDATE